MPGEAGAGFKISSHSLLPSESVATLKALFPTKKKATHTCIYTGTCVIYIYKHTFKKEELLIFSHQWGRKRQMVLMIEV